MTHAADQVEVAHAVGISRIERRDAVKRFQVVDMLCMGAPAFDSLQALAPVAVDRVVVVAAVAGAVGLDIMVSMQTRSAEACTRGINMLMAADAVCCYLTGMGRCCRREAVAEVAAR